MNQEISRMNQHPVSTTTEATDTGRPERLSTEPAAHYDRVTDAWQYLIGDDLHAGYFEHPNVDLSSATEALTRLMADSARLTPGLEVLDIGCGTGNPAIYLASQRGCRVTGISTSGVGIKRAKARSAKGGVGDRVMFHVADGTGTGYADNNFDCIWIMESSHLIPQKNLLVKEANRLLRAGGTLALCDFVLRRPIPPQPSLTLGHDLMVLEEVFGKTTLELLDTYVTQFEECGMNAEGRDISREVLPTFDRWRRNSERHASRVAEILGAKPVERFARSCDIMTRLFETGQLGYGIVSARKTIS